MSTLSPAAAGQDSVPNSDTTSDNTSDNTSSSPNNHASAHVNASAHVTAVAQSTTPHPVNATQTPHPASPRQQQEKQQQRPLTKRPNQNQMMKRRPSEALCALEPARYRVNDGLREVVPYIFRYETFCKGRWVGKPLLEAVADEFAGFSRDYFVRAMADGLLLVNSTLTVPEYVVKDKDRITHFMHRHEPPVLADEVRVVGEDEAAGIVAVDKPPTAPVHPCGRYNFNSVVKILTMQQPKLAGLQPIHRLDRLTSGVLLLGRNGKAVAEAQRRLKDGGGAEKIYFARVDGRFPRDAEDPAFAAVKERLAPDHTWLSAEWLPWSRDGAGPADGGGGIGAGGDSGGGAGAGAGGGGRDDGVGDMRSDADDGGGGRGGETAAETAAKTAAAAAVHAQELPIAPKTASTRPRGDCGDDPLSVLSFSCPMKVVLKAKSRHACVPDGKEVGLLALLEGETR
jgi:hypothetical protein